jgi:hypothetical protein
MKSLHPTCLFMLITAAAVAQQTPVHEKRSFTDSAGRYFQQASLPVYLFVGNSPDGNKTPLLSTTKQEIILEGHGVHKIKHENHLTQKSDEFLIHADGQEPITISSFTNAPEFSSNGKQFYGAGLTVTLTARDEMSGIDAIYHSINNAAFGPYQTPNFTQEGAYQYSYYAVDKTGNAEKTAVKNFVVDLTPPSTYHNFISISSAQVISTNSSIYLTVTDVASGVRDTFYRFDKEVFKRYTGGNIPFQYLPDGQHTLVYFSVDAVSNKEVQKEFTFYLDKTAPIMSADVLGDKFLVGDRVYFSGRTKLKLTAIDNKSGVKQVMYSLNNESENQYTEPFYLPSRSGIHTVKFRALDNTNNSVKDDFEHSIGVIYVDLTGPALSHAFQGARFSKGDTIYIGPTSTIAISGTDPEAGLKKVTYSLDQNSTEVPFQKPFSVAEKGFHKISYYGYDNVNNRNAREAFFVVDTDGPEVSFQFSAPANAAGKYPSYTTIYLSAADVEVGASDIRFSVNGGKEMPYISPIRGFAKNKVYTIKATAVDYLGNKKSSVLKFSTDTY